MGRPPRAPSEPLRCPRSGCARAPRPQTFLAKWGWPHPGEGDPHPSPNCPLGWVTHGQRRRGSDSGRRHPHRRRSGRRKRGRKGVAEKGEKGEGPEPAGVARRGGEGRGRPLRRDSRRCLTSAPFPAGPPSLLTPSFPPWIPPKSFWCLILHSVPSSASSFPRVSGPQERQSMLPPAEVGREAFS